MMDPVPQTGGPTAHDGRFHLNQTGGAILLIHNTGMPMAGSFGNLNRSINTYREGSFRFFMKVALLGFTSNLTALVYLL